MFKVLFNGVTFSVVDSDVEAVQLSLALHQSSNQSHSICVFESEKAEDPVITLYRK